MPHTENNQLEVKRYYTVSQIKEFSTSNIIENIKSFLYSELALENFSEGQILSWKKSIVLLKSIFVKENNFWKIIFEFPIPLSSGKRPDILLINGTTIFLIEVKNKKEYSQADLDQINGYQFDLKFYHSTAKNFDIKPILLLLGVNNHQIEKDGISIISSEKLKPFLLNGYQEFQMINTKSLYEGQFKPIPSITEYARSIFNKTEIKNVETPIFEESNAINEDLEKIYVRCKEKKRNSVVFIRGQAGSGKTAIGLNSINNFGGLYVTKNRQFSEHLISELGHYSNIKTSHNFLKEFSKGDKIPSWNVVVFDEAQRFWSFKKMKEYFNVKKTEHNVILDLFSKKDWCLLIILIGEGQDIGWGEYSDLDEWKEAIGSSQCEWDIYGTKQTKKELDNCEYFQFIEKVNFDLLKSFRNIKTPNYSLFINSLLGFEDDFNSIDFQKLKNEYESLMNGGFKIIITRDIDNGIKYCKTRYFDKPNSYCTLSSSQCNIESTNDLIFDYGISSKLKINDYLKNNGNKENSIYPLTEYSAIGFEVEMPILVWGLDFLWYKGRWNYEFITYLKGQHNYRRNAYRILLTRGRDGVVLYFPKTWEFDNSFKFFENLGATIL